MSNQDELFELQELHNKWYAVVWSPQQWRGVYVRRSKIKLLQILFEEMNCDQVGLAVSLTNQGSESEQVLYLDSECCSSPKHTETVVDALLSTYCIQGVSFAKLETAQQFKKRLEDLYLIKLLSQNYDTENPFSY